jgi:hypothetical protein
MPPLEPLPVDRRWMHPWRRAMRNAAQGYPYPRPDASFVYVDGTAYQIVAGQPGGAPGALQVAHPDGGRTIE